MLFSADAYSHGQLVGTVVFVEMLGGPFRYDPVSQSVVETGTVVIHTPGEASTTRGVASQAWCKKIIPEHFYSILLANPNCLEFFSKGNTSHLCAFCPG